MELRREPFDSTAAQLMIDRVQQEYVVRYGGPDQTPVDPTQFTAAAGGAFVVGYLDGVPVATGGFRRHDGSDQAEGAAGLTVELKRMYVVPEQRGRGLSRLVLAQLEALAVASGAQRVVLETGDKQPEAMALYASSGYDRIAGFGYYGADAVCYGKLLTEPVSE